MIRAMIRSMRCSLVGSNGRITTRLLLGFRTMPVRRTFNRDRCLAGPRRRSSWSGSRAIAGCIIDPFASMEVGS